MIRQALLRTSLALGLLALVTSCAELPSTTTSVAPTPPPQGYWNGDGVSGAPKIIVSISDQRAYFYKGKQLVGESTVSTGKPGFGTPPGYYTVFWKHADHVSSVFGDYVDEFGNVVKGNIDSRKDSKPPGTHYDGARMPFAMFFRGGYAMHQGYVPPYAASHGCIRLPAGMAEVFFNASPPGTPVIVKQESVMPNFTVPPDAATIAPPAQTMVRSTAPPPIRPAVVRTTTIQAPTPVPLRTPVAVVSRPPAPLRSPAPVVLRSPSTTPPRSPAPNVVRTTTTTPPAVRPTTVRTTIPAPSPTPLRSPAAVLYRKPAPLQSPAPLQTTSPFPLRSTAPAPIRRTTVPMTTPVPLRSPAPTLSRNPMPVQSPTPLPLRSRGPASVRPTPTPVPSRTKGPVRKKARAPAPSPTPTPTPRR